MASLRTVAWSFLRKFGLVCAAWTVTLVAASPAGNQTLLWATAATVVVWAAVSMALPTVWWGAGWLVVATALELAGPAAGTGGWSVVGGATFLVIAAAAVHGRRRVVLGVVVVLSAAALARPLLSPGWNAAGGVSTLLIFALGATALTWMMRLIVGTVAERDRLAADLARAEQDRAVAAEREEAAARLHDSVLQTLAQLERTAPDAGTAQLAATASSDLRRFLRHRPSDDEFLAELERTVHNAAGAERSRLGLATVGGDRPCDERHGLLVAAAAEAVRNAVVHTEGPVRVTCEMSATSTVVWVSDRGRGFDPDEVAEDRLGVRESIVGRMRRAGGDAVPRRRAAGFEWELHLPLTKT